MAAVRCPDCGEVVPVPAGARAGDLLECPNWAGFSLRLRETGGEWSAAIAPHVSCPGCWRTIVLPEGAKAGDRVECCGRRYVLTFAYGAFALEAPAEDQ